MKKVAEALPNLIAEYPALDPVGTCRSYLDKLAWLKANKKPPVKYHDSYLAGHFQREADKLAAEPPNPHGAGTPFFTAEKADELYEPETTTPPPHTAEPVSEKAGEVITLEDSVHGTSREPETVRTLLLPGGKLHKDVPEAMEYASQAPDILARRVAGHLGGKPEEYVEEVVEVLKEIPRAESEVA
jgi:hypothetical protein